MPRRLPFAFLMFAVWNSTLPRLSAAPVPTRFDQGIRIGNVTVSSGSAAPESSLTAPPGSLYLRSSGGSGTTLYYKASGTGNTGWTAVSNTGGGGGPSAFSDLTGAPADNSALSSALAAKVAAASNLSDLANAATARANLGIGNIDNTADASKPVSTAQATAIAADGVVLKHASTRTAYTTLALALAAAASGDTVEVGPGTWSLGTTQHVIPAGVTLTGSGWNTILSGDKRSNNLKIAGNNVTIANCKIICTTPSNSNGHSIIGNESAGFTGLRIVNCWLVGEQDVFNGFGIAGTQTMQIYGGRIDTAFDWLNAAGGTGTVELFGPMQINSDGSANVDPSAGLSAIGVPAGLTLRASNVTWTVTHPPSGDHSPGIVTSGGAALLLNCTVTTESGGLGDLYNNSGTLTVIGGSGSGTNGAFTSTGTITRLGSDYAFLRDSSNQATGTLPVGRLPALTGGDATTSAGSGALALATVNSNVGTVGSSTSIPAVTVDAKGRITAASGNAVIASAATLSGTTLNSAVVNSSLTNFGTVTLLTLASGVNVRAGSGSPEGSVTASVSSVYLRTDGTANSTVYLKVTGAGNTGWTALTTTLPTMSTDPLWQAKGDLAAGQSSFQSARLAVGSNGQVLTADSAQTNGIKWNSLGSISTQAASAVAVTGGTIAGTRVSARITSITSNATPTVNTDNCDCVNITALAAAITSMTTNLSGTPADFDQLEYRIKDNGTARAINWGASFVSGPATLPSTTTISKTLRVWTTWDAALSKWVCVGTGSDA